MIKSVKQTIVLVLLVLSFSVSAQDKKTIVFFGNSLTAGLGVKPEESFPGVIKQKLVQNGYNYDVVNAGLSGETTAGGLARIDWILKNHKMNIFVLELGANDGLRGLDVEQTKKNLIGIIEKVKAAQPNAKIILTGMQVPPNMGADYSKRFAAIFKETAESHKVALVPFLLDGVGGDVKYNQADRIHPNVEGHKILAENVWVVLKRMM